MSNGQRVRLSLVAGVVWAGCALGPDQGGAVETASSALTTTLNPVADTYVRDGSNANTSFGSSATLEVKRDGTGLNREAYLRFSLASFTGNVQSAKLRVFGSNSSGGTVPVVVSLLRDASFDEATLTYATRPEPLPIELGRIKVNGPVGTWYEVDVTGLVRQKKRAGDATIQLLLHSLVTSAPVARLNSREAASSKPELVIETATALFVVGNTALGAGDAAVSARLQQLGYALTIKAATAAVSGDATGKSFVVISSTVTSGDVNTKFRDVAVPVVVWENGVYDDMKMTGTVSGTDFGTTAGQTAVSVVNASVALAGGREGTVAVASSGPLTWGKPGAGALKLATLTGDASRVTVFGYDRGAAMVGLTAPARRVGLFLGDATAASLTRGGGALFDAAVTWASGAKPFRTVKVAVLNYDPIIESSNNQRLSAVLGIADPHVLVQQMVRDMAQATSDYLRYQVVSLVDRDEWPAALDGSRYDDASYLADWNTQTFREKEVAYAPIISAGGFDAAVNSGRFDDVWIIVPRGHFVFESRMIGPTAFYVNAPPLLPPATAATRSYFIDGMEPTRPVALFEHGYLHRFEWLMRHVYGKKYGPDGLMSELSNWNTSPYGPPCFWATDPSPCATTRRHFWDSFTLVDGIAQNLRAHGDAAAVAGVGAVHFVPNAELQIDHNYDYGDSFRPALSPVSSNADDWMYNFPALTGETRQVAPAEWAFSEPGGEGFQSGFMLWFANHVPRVAGRHTDGVLDNWWEYVVNFNDYAETQP